MELTEEAISSFIHSFIFIFKTYGDISIALNQSGRFDHPNASGSSNVPYANGTVTGDTDNVLLVNGIADIIYIARY